MIIKLTTPEWSLVREEIRLGNKIAAIKAVRDARHHRIPADLSPLSSQSWRGGVGLREAKGAVEFHMHSMGINNSDGSPCWRGGIPAGRLAPAQPIKRIVLDMGDGEIEVDMDGMSLNFLSTMSSLKMDDVQRLLDLYKRVKDWEEGS